MSNKHVLVSVAATVLGVLALGACGQAATAGAPVGIAVAAAAQREEPASVSLNAAEIDGLGTILTDQDGMTLYRFDRDSADPPTSNCDGECTVEWLPVLADAEDVVVAGFDRSVVGSIVRVDGDSQVTVGGWPLYRYAKDSKPGDTTGNGVGDVWFAVGPEGARAGGEPVKPSSLVGRELPNFGVALTDQDGFTLYLFTKDSKDPSVSTCYGECAKTWPPVLVENGEPELAGVDPALVGSVDREDGGAQLTVGGWPVYRYSKDSAPGQTNGHGVGGTWFVIEPAGCKSLAPVQEQAPDADAEPESGTGY